MDPLVADLPGAQSDFIQRWQERAAEFERYRASVDGAVLCREMLTDLAAVQAARANRVLSLSEAAEWSGYSEAHLARLVKQAKLPTLRPVGSRGRLTFWAADLPRKTSPQHTSHEGVHDLASRLSTKRGKEARNGRL
jgi:predicted DNA-binding transcriptional regulator AlpA